MRMEVARRRWDAKHVRLTRVFRLVARGWEWWRDPRRPSVVMLRSRSGELFEVRAERGGVELLRVESGEWRGN